MKTAFARLILIALLCLPWAAGAGEIEAIQDRGVLVVSLNKGYPPFAMSSEGQMDLQKWSEEGTASRPSATGAATSPEGV